MELGRECVTAELIRGRRDVSRREGSPILFWCLWLLVYLLGCVLLPPQRTYVASV